MSNGTTSSKKDGSLKKANWVDSAPKEGVEGHDYFIRGTKYTNSNVSAKYGGVMNMSGITPAFKPFSYDEEKPIKTGSASSLDRMQAMVDNLNQSSSTVVNNPNISQFKEETKYEIPDADENVKIEAKKAQERYLEQKLQKQNAMWKKQNENVKSEEGIDLYTDHPENVSENSQTSDSGQENPYAGLSKEEALELFDKNRASGQYEYGGSKYQGYGGLNMGLGGVIGHDLELSEQVGNWLPGAGEVIDAKNSYQDFAKGDIVGGVSNMAGFAIPFVPGRLIKKGVNAYIDQVFPGFKTFGNPFDKVSPKNLGVGDTKMGKISKKAKDLKKQANRAKTNYEYATSKEDTKPTG